jgi:NAD(P)H-hydrate epimerase
MLPLTRAQIRELDRRAIEEFGVPGVVLMENASRGLLEAVRRAYPDHTGRRIVIVAGTGNNGGDGFALDRHLFNAGLDCVTVIVGDPASVRGDARVNLDILARMDRAPRTVDAPALREALRGAGLIVDALLGTGLSRPVEGVYREAIGAIDAARESGVPVVAVDIPSGLDADTGEPLGAAVRADLTVTFVAPKTGFDSPSAAEYLGRVEVVREIGIPRQLLDALDTTGVTAREGGHHD